MKETHSIRSFARLVRDMRQAQQVYETGKRLDSRTVIVLLRQRDELEARVDLAIAEILGPDLPFDEEDR